MPARFNSLLTTSALMLGCIATSVSALQVRRTEASLKDAASTFAPVDAPKSSFADASSSSQFQAQPASSQFGAAAQAGSVFRESEVPPSRLAATRELLQTLQARQTPDRAIVIELPADVLFDFDRAELRPDARQPLEKAAALLSSYPQANLSIYGHTDAKGTDAYNQPLSERRAAAVAAFLQAQAGRTAQSRGFGKQRPVAANVRADGSDDPQGRQRNRRVEIVIEPPASDAAKPRP